MNDAHPTNGRPVEDPEIARRRANEGTGRRTHLERMQAIEHDSIDQGGRAGLPPQPALPDEDGEDDGEDDGDEEPDEGDEEQVGHRRLKKLKE